MRCTSGPSFDGCWLVPPITTDGFLLYPSAMSLGQSCYLSGKGRASPGNQKKWWGTAWNDISWVASGSGRQESSRQNGDKEVQHCEMVFEGGMEEEEEEKGGPPRLGQCQETMSWCCCHQFILDFRQII